MTYRPEKLASLYDSELGQRIWSFLTRDDNVARIETASQMSKPAVEGIEEQHLAEFREEVLADRVKQMVGHMVRQILEQRDWVLDQTDVKVQPVPFSKAARHRRPDWFTFHAFRNSRDPCDVVITDRRQNPTLPADALDLPCDLRQPAEGRRGVWRWRPQAASPAGPCPRLSLRAGPADAAPGVR